MSDSGMITTLDEFEAEYRKGIGSPLPHRWTTQASLDNIRRFGGTGWEITTRCGGTRITRRRVGSG